MRLIAFFSLVEPSGPQENKVLANQVYGQVKLQFDEGMASLTDLLNVETSLLEAENLFNQQLLNTNLQK